VAHRVDTVHHRYAKPDMAHFDMITRLEDEYGAVSTWFVLTDPKEAYRYNPADLRPHLADLIASGHEIGLHGGMNTDRSCEDIIAQRTALEDVISHDVAGYRSHYLTFRTPTTWSNLAECGFAYDTTFGYADCAGFRNGMCHPFRPVDLWRGHEIDIVEVPLVIMDRTLTSYMNLTEETSRLCIRQLLTTVRDLHGGIAVNWHNHVIQEDPTMFGYILDTCAELGAWMPTCSELVEFWRKHG
jgi:peptidoglycan/xylan/chitin deacetylase (PgdA/CDA1 family)